MFDNDFETAINFYFFLKESEYVFSQFVTTVGKTDPDTGELFLEDNPAFRNYKKKSRKAIDNHTNAPHLTQKTKNFYLDKCRYYLYPEKRKPYKLKMVKASTQRVHFQTDVLQCSFLSLESIFLF